MAASDPWDSSLFTPKRLKKKKILSYYFFQDSWESSPLLSSSPLLCKARPGRCTCSDLPVRTNQCSCLENCGSGGGLKQYSEKRGVTQIEVKLISTYLSAQLLVAWLSTVFFYSHYHLLLENANRSNINYNISNKTLVLTPTICAALTLLHWTVFICHFALINSSSVALYCLFHSFFLVLVIVSPSGNCLSWVEDGFVCLSRMSRSAANLSLM